MKYRIITLLCLMLAPTAQADVYRDRNGVMSGSATTDSGGKTIYRDRNGVMTGSKQK